MRDRKSKTRRIRVARRHSVLGTAGCGGSTGVWCGRGGSPPDQAVAPRAARPPAPRTHRSRSVTKSMRVPTTCMSALLSTSTRTPRGPSTSSSNLPGASAYDIAYDSPLQPRLLTDSLRKGLSRAERSSATRAAAASVSSSAWRRTRRGAAAGGSAAGAVAAAASAAKPARAHSTPALCKSLASRRTSALRSIFLAGDTTAVRLPPMQRLRKLKVQNSQKIKGITCCPRALRDTSCCPLLEARPPVQQLRADT